MSERTYIDLIKAHRHAGRDYPPGAVLGVDADQAEWLCAIGTARPATPGATQAGAAPAQPQPKAVKAKE